MSYPEKRAGRLTGTWLAEVDFGKKGGGRWRGRYPTKQEADRAEDLVRATGTPLDRLGADAGAPTFADVVRECKDAGGPRARWHRGKDASGQGRLEFVTSRLGLKPITAIDSTVLEGLVRDLAKRPVRTKTRMTASTINRYLSAVSAVLRYAGRKHYISTMPELPWQHEEPKAIGFFTRDQETAICRALEDKGLGRAALCVRVLAATGMRWSELAGLEAAQVEDDETRGVIRLTKTKTDAPRVVYMPHDLALKLRAMLASGGVGSYWTFREQYQKAQKDAGVKKVLGVHALRHTTATRLLDEKVPLPIAQRFLGHKAIQTTLRYQHVTDDALAQAAEKLSRTAGETPAEVIPMVRKVQ